MTMDTADTSPLGLLHAGLRHHNEGRFDEAGAHYRVALCHDPRSVDALRLLGVVEGVGGRILPALRLVGSALTVEPGHQTARANLAKLLPVAYGDADALARAGNIIMAGRLCHAVLRVAPEEADARRFLPMLTAAMVTMVDRYRQASRDDLAELALDHARELTPDDADVLIRSATLASQWCRNAQSGRWSAMALALRPESAPALALRALLPEPGAAPGAMTWLNRAMAVDPQAVPDWLRDRDATAPAPAPAPSAATSAADFLAEFHHLLGLLLGRKGFPQDAIAAFRRSLDRDAGRMDVWRNLVAGLRRLGRTDEALRACEAGLEQCPGDPALCVHQLALTPARQRARDRLPPALATTFDSYAFQSLFKAVTAMERPGLLLAPPAPPPPPATAADPPPPGAPGGRWAAIAGLPAGGSARLLALLAPLSRLRADGLLDGIVLAAAPDEVPDGADRLRFIGKLGVTVIEAPLDRQAARQAALYACPPGCRVLALRHDLPALPPAHTLAGLLSGAVSLERDAPDGAGWPELSERIAVAGGLLHLPFHLDDTVMFGRRDDLMRLAGPSPPTSGGFAHATPAERAFAQPFLTAMPVLEDYLRHRPPPRYGGPGGRDYLRQALANDFFLMAFANWLMVLHRYFRVGFVRRDHPSYAVAPDILSAVTVSDWLDRVPAPYGCEAGAGNDQGLPLSSRFSTDCWIDPLVRGRLRGDILGQRLSSTINWLSDIASHERYRQRAGVLAGMRDEFRQFCPPSG
jgi:tetratricopeptide (TPR) repeat protein